MAGASVNVGHRYQEPEIAVPNIAPRPMTIRDESLDGADKSRHTPLALEVWLAEATSMTATEAES